jgi:hypothetical protein
MTAHILATGNIDTVAHKYMTAHILTTGNIDTRNTQIAWPLTF